MSSNWQKDREMSGQQFETAIKRLGLSQAAAGRFLGHSERQMRRYVTGEAVVPTAEALLLRLMIAKGEKPVAPPWVKGGY